MTVGLGSSDAGDIYYRCFHGLHHARFIDPETPVHIISRVFQGRHLLRPCDDLNALIVGVVGRAQRHYVSVHLYAMAFLSNHVHFMVQGPPGQVASFVGFIKREISRRWGRRAQVGWHGTMWHEYLAAALPTPQSQVRCLKYILSQGVKEGLVTRPQDWPGVHCARSLATGLPLKGTWLNATRYSRALDAQSRTRHPKIVNKSDYRVEYEVKFAAIPPWQSLDESAQQVEVQRLIDEVVAEGHASRAGRRVLGPRRIRRVALDRRTELPPQPWFTRSRRLICWASPSDPATRRFLSAYWEFQQSFRQAAIKDARQRAQVFCAGAFAPGHWITAIDELTAPS